MNKETYKAYLQQRINEKFVGTETDVPNINKTNSLPPTPIRNKRRPIGINSNLMSGLRPANPWMSHPNGSQTYDDRMGARLDKSDPYRIHTGFALSRPTPEEQAEIEKNKEKPKDYNKKFVAWYPNLVNPYYTV